MTHVHTESSDTPMEAAIALGSNLGDRLQHLRQAVTSLRRALGTNGQLSRIYQTPAIDCPEPLPFLNAVWVFQTTRSPSELLSICAEVEQESGRARNYPNAPRTLDLDLLYVGSCVLEQPQLIVPHPRMHQRLFVLLPLAELRPNWVHPNLATPITHLVQANLDLNANHGLEATRLSWSPSTVFQSQKTL